jgi:hypothetical protein
MIWLLELGRQRNDKAARMVLEWSRIWKSRYWNISCSISEKLGFKSLDEYISDIVRANMRMELEGTGNFESEHIEEIERLIALIYKYRQMDR